MTLDAAATGRCLDAIRARRPLIHNITNLVVTNSTANALLALGASPAMVEGADEVEEFAAISAATSFHAGASNRKRSRRSKTGIGDAHRSMVLRADIRFVAQYTARPRMPAVSTAFALSVIVG